MLMTVVAVALFGCSEGGHDVHQKEDKHTSEEHENAIILHREQEKIMGIKVSEVISGPFRQVVKVGGEISPSQSSQAVVSAKSDGTVQFAQGITTGVSVNKNMVICSISSADVSGGDPKNEAKIQYDAAKKEYERTKQLYESQLATAKDFRAAEQAFDIARNALEGNAKSNVAKSPISGVVSQLFVQNGSFVTVGTPMASVCASSKLVLKAIVPFDYYTSTPLFRSANFKLPYKEELFELDKMGGKRITSETMQPSASGYFTLEYEFENNGEVVPGSYAEIFLLGGLQENVISVPLSAIIEEQGTYSVFVKVADEHFEKRPVVLGNTDGANIEVKSGLTPGEQIVTEGAVYVKLASNTNAIPEGHHH